MQVKKKGMKREYDFINPKMNLISDLSSDLGSE
jgi:hypothetical protein